MSVGRRERGGIRTSEARGDMHTESVRKQATTYKNNCVNHIHGILKTDDGGRGTTRLSVPSFGWACPSIIVTGTTSRWGCLCGDGGSMLVRLLGMPSTSVKRFHTQGGSSPVSCTLHACYAYTCGVYVCVRAHACVYACVGEQTALHYAAREGRTKCIEVLLYHGKLCFAMLVRHLVIDHPCPLPS